MPAAEVRLVVSVKDARNFPLEWLNGNHRPYLQFVIPGAGRGSTAPWLGDTQPQWKEHFEFMVDPLNDQLALSVGLMDERRKEVEATPVAHVAVSIMDVFHTSKLQVKLGNAIYSSLSEIYLVLNFDHCFPPAPPKSMIELIARSRAAGSAAPTEEREPVSGSSRSAHHHAHLPTSDVHQDGNGVRRREWESPVLPPDQTDNRLGRRAPASTTYLVRSPERPPQLFLADSMLATGPSDPAPWSDDWSVVDGHVPSVSDWPQPTFGDSASKRLAPASYLREDGRPLPDSFSSPKLLKRALLRRQNASSGEFEPAGQEAPQSEVIVTSRERADSDTTKRSLSGGSRRARSAVVTEPLSVSRRTPSQERERGVPPEEVPRSPPVRTRSTTRRQQEHSLSNTQATSATSTSRPTSPPLLVSPRAGQRPAPSAATAASSNLGLQPYFGSGSRNQTTFDTATTGTSGLPRPPSWSAQRAAPRQTGTSDVSPLPPPPATVGTVPTDSFGSAINLLDPLASARQMAASAARVRRVGRTGGDTNPPLP
eukprot:TRINITY_DN14098_c0_g1_i1.p1 TRINITY_DN14098_c0_g1~~TRINITY_DN14098_c0_g1_i1.p1  ORF type:complete len:539 (-),score=31.44 TRINITY_DN14098_c0_g1_i1:64-1680(-)